MTSFFSNRKSMVISGLCCSLLLLSSCATTTRAENNIEERVTARWDTLLSGDLAGAYEFLSPGFRSSVPSLRYQRQLLLNKVKWTSAQYIESDCTETTCKVKISLGYTVYGAIPGVNSFDGTQETEESWVNINGNWYFVPNK
jgi:hypothetical protein